ncbi:MAG: YfhO family protein [Elusimicrobiota bacterium]|jgi:uncharacterized membrane protein YfhO|nr:YfhO family protein [Elusimicrobiota bacterium]
MILGSENIKLESKKNFPIFSLNDREYYLYVYSLVFLVLASFSFFWIWSNGKSLITLGDGMHQHYPFLVYWGKYLRQVFFNFIGGNFSIPLYDFNIGYGSDIITSLHYNVIGDPLALLSFFVPMRFSEIFYDFLTVFRMYLAGIAFSFFYYSIASRKTPSKADEIEWGIPALVGSVCYVFSTYALTSIFAPFFINQMIYLPLLLAGAENILDGKKPYFFIIMVFVALVSNFYFFYPTSFLTVFFVLIRLHFRKILFKNWKIPLRITFYYFTGILMACFIFIPNLIALLQSQRFGVSHPFDLFYTFDMYKQALLAFISVSYPFAMPGVPLHFEVAGFPLICLFAIVAMFCKRNKFSELKVSFIILTLLALLPFGGYLLNAFSYVSNRWTYGYSFLIALITAIVISELKFTYSKIVKLVIVVFTVTNAAFTAYTLYELKDYKREFMDKDKSYLTETENHFKAINTLNDKNFFRTEDIQYYTFIEIRNLSLLMGVKTVGFFYSLVNPYVSLFNSEFELYNHQEHELKNLDTRTILGTLANVKYFVLPSKGSSFLPYGYEEEISQCTNFKGEVYSVFKNKYALPFGYTYSSFLPRHVYQSLSPVQKQQALLQGAVIEEKLDEEFKELSDLTLREQTLFLPILEGNNVGGQLNRLIIPSDNFTVSFNFNGIANSETYIRLCNMSYLSESKYSGLSNVVMATLGTSMRASEVLSKRASWYSGKKYFMLNLGFNNDKKDSLAVVFQKSGIFDCQSIEITSLPFDQDYQDKIESLKQNHLENVEEFTNGIKGKISLSENKILLLSIPYSKGWKAYVNGKKTKLLRTNTMFMSLPLKAGNYDITLKYITPGLFTGLIFSLVGVGLFWLIIKKKL